MILTFTDRKSEKEFNDFKSLKKKYGDPQGRKINQRLDELRAADTLADISHLPPPRLHELVGNKAGQFSVDVIYPYRLLFKPAHDPVPVRDDGGINLSAVTAILILGVENTHGK